MLNINEYKDFVIAGNKEENEEFDLGNIGPYSMIMTPRNYPSIPKVIRLFNNELKYRQNISVSIIAMKFNNKMFIKSTKIHWKNYSKHCGFENMDELNTTLTEMYSLYVKLYNILETNKDLKDLFENIDKNFEFLLCDEKSYSNNDLNRYKILKIVETENNLMNLKKYELILREENLLWF